MFRIGREWGRGGLDGLELIESFGKVVGMWCSFDFEDLEFRWEIGYICFRLLIIYVFFYLINIY